MLLKALDHFCPMVREDVTLAAAPFVIEHPVSLCADRYAALVEHRHASGLCAEVGLNIVLA